MQGKTKGYAMATTTEDKTDATQADTAEYTAIESAHQPATEGRPGDETVAIAARKAKTSQAKVPDITGEVPRTRLSDVQPATRELLLQKLLATAESAAQRAELSRRKWQLAFLLSTLLFVPALAVIVWLSIDTSTMRIEQARLRMDNYALAEQVKASGIQAAGLTRRRDLLENQNARLTLENSRLKTDNISLTAGAVHPPAVVSSVNKQTPRNRPPAIQNNQQNPPPKKPMSPLMKQSRLNDIKKGVYPLNMAKAELLVALGRPDRIYVSGIYEQLLYFDRSPGRFWFTNNVFIQTAK